MRIHPLGDAALVVEVGDRIDEATHRRVQQVWRALEKARLPGVLDLVPAYTSVTLFYDPQAVGDAGAPAEGLAAWIEELVRGVVALIGEPVEPPQPPRTVEIPVCYGGAFGPDLPAVAAHVRQPAEEVVRLHHTAAYFVHMIGFAPGFPYLGGLPAQLQMPRRTEPRTEVPAGSVAIAGVQSGIYPIATPGGWNLIGRTPLRLFDARAESPSLLVAGDRVRFRPVSVEEFRRLEGAR